MRALPLSLLALAICSGQTKTESKVTLAGEGCLADANFEQPPGYIVVHSEVKNPFDFLPWVRVKERAAAAEISKLVDQQPFRYDTSVGKALDIINEEDFFPSTTLVKIRVRVELVTVHCSGKNQSLVYHVYSSQVTPAMSGTPEGQTAQTHSPQKAAGMSGDQTRYHLTPSFGFDSSDKFYAGGTMSVTLCDKCKFHLQGIAEGQGSQQMRTVHVALKGSHDGLGFIKQSNFMLNFNDSSLPTGVGALGRSVGSLQYSAATRSFLGGNLSARFGGLIEKGNQQAALQTSPVNAAKLYVGLDSRLQNQVFSSSFGMELGATKIGSGVPWQKYVGDFRHDFWHNVGDHRSLDVESRLTLGTLQGGSKIPVAERFFGGNFEQLFMPDDAWQIRANPVIRAIPGARLFSGDRFLSYNVTAAFAAWRRPVVPPEVSHNSKFAALLEGQIKSATSVEQLHFLTLDQHYKTIVSESLPEVVRALESLSSTTASKKCASAIKMAKARANSMQSAHDASQYGFLVTLLKPPSGDPDEDRLTKVIDRCGDAGLDFTTLQSAQNKLEENFQHIDPDSAHDKAVADMKFVRNTLHTLFHGANLISVGPVAVFDIAQIGPTGPGVRGTRYGPGGGVRLELASSVNFTAGYARNLNPGPREGSGAIFFSMGVRDLFH